MTQTKPPEPDARTDALTMARDHFHTLAQHALAKVPPDYDQAAQNSMLASIMTNALAGADAAPVAQSEPATRTVTVDLNDFVWSAASPATRENQMKVWLQLELEKHGFKYAHVLANLDGPYNRPGWWREPIEGTATLWSFNERVDG